ncbi:MAG: hypothetical protein HW394_821 [Acidobacteria bacterium]|nr:hypothetical protein [Acidobacteriota bacterium]
MRHERSFPPHVGRWLFSVIVLVAIATSVSGQAPKRFLTAPLTIEDQGSFFIGGVQKVTNHATVPPPPAPGATPAPAPAAVPHQITIGQMYVQFQIPARKYGAGWPVIMVHGSTHTGACLESTPDGREGWYPYFVRKGVPSYVVDQAGRGRSGFDASVIHEGEARIASGDVTGGTELIPAFGRITDDGAWTNWFGHLVPADSTILTGTLVPHGHSADPNPNPDAYRHVAPLFPTDAVDPKAVSRAGAIGPAPAGANGTYALEYYKQLVPNAEVTLPGSTCSACDPAAISPANTWTPQNLASLVERLGGAIVVTHSQSGIMGHHMARILKERGHLDLLKGLITLEGSCSLPNSGLTAADFDDIPYMALKGDYTGTSMVCQDTVSAINARRASKLGTAKAEYLKLDEMGMLGVTHMMMLDKKNLEIADVIFGWVNRNVRGNGGRVRSTN